MRRAHARGYTITEVLIVISVTGLIFVSATTAFRGRQTQVQFDQAVRDLESTLRDIVNDVSTGYYPTDGVVNCTVSTSQVDRVTVTAAGGSSIGSNNDCLYVGKAVQFAPAGRPSGFDVYNLAGKRFKYFGSKDIAENLNDSKPRAVQSTMQTNESRYGLEFYRIVSSGYGNHGVVVFLANLGGGSVAASTIASSDSQRVQIAGVESPTAVIGATNGVAISAIDAITTNNIEPSGTDGIVICVTDGSNKRASLTLGAGNSSGVELKIGDIEAVCTP